MKTQETWTDPIVEEVHAIRREIVREAGGTLEGLVKSLMESQKRHGDKLVSRQVTPGEGEQDTR